MNGIDTHRLGLGEQRVSVFSQQERYPLFHLGTELWYGARQIGMQYTR